MKTQVAWNFRLKRTELQVSLQRGESLDIAGAEWLQGMRNAYLLPMDYDPSKARSKKLELCYDITGLTALKKRLGKVWSQDSYYTVLEGIERACTECASGTRLVERILFDIDHVYLTEQDEPRFVYVPLNGVAYDASTNNPLLVLGALASRRLRCDSVACSNNVADLRQWVLGKQVFSLNDLRDFLDREFADLRRTQREDPLAVWNARDAKPSTEQLAYLDSLFSSFDAGPAGGADEGEGGTLR